ncbi:MAG: pilus assembly protein PilP [Pseudomonadota bacterium]
MKVSKATFKIVAGIGLVLSLSSCSNRSEMLELQNYVQEQLNRAPGPIDPIPVFVAYEAFTYSAANLRGPFDIPVEISEEFRNQETKEVMPDETRPKEYLESFAIGNLFMVGVIKREGEVWALIRDETSNINRVTVGNYMGRNHGRISAVTDTQIDIVEIVPTGDGGWLERPQSILLQE